MTSQPAEPTSTTEHARRALRDAHAYFRHPCTLDGSWVHGSWVLDYLNRRNLYPQLRDAGIGYAPGGWTTLLDHLRSRGHTDQALLDAGLARTASTGNLIAHFRDRLMIPVVDANHQLVGFTGRAGPTAGPEVPKYLNTPATALFDKSRLLYALGEDRSELAAGALPILVEGPLDRLAIRQAAGNLAVVGLAPLGTAFTEHHARQLADTLGTRRAVAVAFDSDLAGQHAAVRVWDRLTEVGFTSLLHVALPDGRDPADLVRAGHNRQLRHAILVARPLSLAVADHRIAQAGVVHDWHQQYAVLQHVLDHDLTRIPPDRLGPYLAHLTHRLDLDYQTVTAAAIDRLSPTAGAARSATGSEDRRHVVEGFTARVTSSECFPTGTHQPSLSSASESHEPDVEDSQQQGQGRD